MRVVRAQTLYCMSQLGLLAGLEQGTEGRVARLSVTLCTLAYAFVLEELVVQSSAHHHQDCGDRIE